MGSPRAPTLGYDNLAHVTSRDAPGTQPDITYGYDLLGRQISQSSSSQSITTVFDALSRVGSVISPLGTVGYEYDGYRRKQLTYPGGFYVTYQYYDSGDLKDILQNGSTSIGHYTYDNLGRRQSLTRGNGVVTTYGFNARSGLQSLQLTGSSQNTTFGFDYSPAGQISTRTQTDSVYNAVLPAGTDQTSVPNGLNQYTSVTGITPSYGDGRGNLTGDGTKTYGYDYDNHLTSASAGVSLEYDPAGRLFRVATSSSGTRFLYDGDDVIAEYDGSSGTVLHRYVHGSGSDEPLVSYEGSGTTDRRWTIADERGSVIGIANDSGTVTQINKYDAYGVPDSGNLGRFQYTGQMWISELALYHYKARAYNPRLGRFMQADPIGHAGGMNLYAYAGGDPVNLIDSSGLTCTTTEPMDPLGDAWQNCTYVDPYPSAVIVLMNPGAADMYQPTVVDPSLVSANSVAATLKNAPQERHEQHTQTCPRGAMATLGNGLVQFGKTTTSNGFNMIQVGATFMLAGGAASAVGAPFGAPELGVPAIEFGEGIATVGTGVATLGIGMQAAGGLILATQGNRQPLGNAVSQAVQMELERFLHVPDLPILMKDPLDQYAERLAGENPCE